MRSNVVALKTSDESAVRFVDRPQTAVAEQMPLFTREIILEFGTRNRTADTAGQARADDGHTYYLKDDRGQKLIRASEMICSYLAEFAGIATPQYAVLRRSDSRLLFGSRRICKVSEETDTTTYLLRKTTDDLGRCMVGLGPLLSGIFAFDMAVSNVDRHLGNFLSVNDYDDRVIYIHDFSRALLWNWNWSQFPDAQSNTRVVARQLRQLHGFDLASVERVLDRLAQIPISSMYHIFGRMPPNWLPDSDRRMLLRGWEDGLWQRRIDVLRRGLVDGALL